MIEFPLKVVIGAAGWAREKLASEPPPPKPSEIFARRLEENLVTAATSLHQQLVSPQVAGTAFRRLAGRDPELPASAGSAPDPVNAHPAAEPAQERLRKKDFSAILKAVLARQNEIGDIGADMEHELRGLADHFRGRMLARVAREPAAISGDDTERRRFVQAVFDPDRAPADLCALYAAIRA